MDTHKSNCKTLPLSIPSGHNRSDTGVEIGHREKRYNYSATAKICEWKNSMEKFLIMANYKFFPAKFSRSARSKYKSTLWSNWSKLGSFLYGRSGHGESITLIDLLWCLTCVNHVEERKIKQGKAHQTELFFLTWCSLLCSGNRTGLKRYSQINYSLNDATAQDILKWKKWYNRWGDGETFIWSSIVRYLMHRVDNKNQLTSGNLRRSAVWG